MRHGPPRDARRPAAAADPLDLLLPLGGDGRRQGGRRGLAVVVRGRRLEPGQAPAAGVARLRLLLRAGGLRRGPGGVRRAHGAERGARAARGRLRLQGLRARRSGVLLQRRCVGRGALPPRLSGRRLVRRVPRQSVDAARGQDALVLLLPPDARDGADLVPDVRARPHLASEGDPDADLAPHPGPRRVQAPPRRPLRALRGGLRPLVRVGARRVPGPLRGARPPRRAKVARGPRGRNMRLLRAAPRTGPRGAPRRDVRTAPPGGPGRTTRRTIARATGGSGSTPTRRRASGPALASGSRPPATSSRPSTSAPSSPAPSPRASRWPSSATGTCASSRTTRGASRAASRSPSPSSSARSPTTRPSCGRGRRR